ncbi:MAG: FHA domain-containing protein [Saprospiraceae bacterium]|nr:FHA domain-containing protein [Saprospiraceae bacterium]
MAARTEQFKSAASNLGRTLGQSLSMITGKDIPNYSLLFLDASMNRKRGEHETIFMPHIVLGRSSRCHVRFGDEHKTVSREHASITVDGSNFVINHNPSASNPTYVNGRAIGGAHNLQNGDEIQLSSNGPKMRFNASTLKTSTIGLTSRIGQAMAQAVKPYKTALWIMGLLLLGALGLAGYNMYQNGQMKEELITLQNEKNDIDDKLLF